MSLWLGSSTELLCILVQLPPWFCQSSGCNQRGQLTCSAIDTSWNRACKGWSAFECILIGIKLCSYNLIECQVFIVFNVRFAGLPVTAYTSEGENTGLLPYFDVVSHLKSHWADGSGNRHWRYCLCLNLFTSYPFFNACLGFSSAVLILHVLELAGPTNPIWSRVCYFMTDTTWWLKPCCCWWWRLCKHLSTLRSYQIKFWKSEISSLVFSNYD